jgi:hypothetical protein
MNPTPAVVVPMNEDMATEPAVTLGQKFSDATFVKALIGAAFTIIGVVAPHLITKLDDNLANAISTAVVLLASVVVAQQAKSVPKQQAAQTREAVYSPSSVADIVAAERPTENVDAVVIDSPQGNDLPR